MFFWGEIPETQKVTEALVALSETFFLSWTISRKNWCKNKERHYKVVYMCYKATSVSEGIQISIYARAWSRIMSRDIQKKNYNTEISSDMGQIELIIVLIRTTYHYRHGMLTRPMSHSPTQLHRVESAHSHNMFLIAMWWKYKLEL